MEGQVQKRCNGFRLGLAKGTGIKWNDFTVVQNLLDTYVVVANLPQKNQEFWR